MFCPTCGKEQIDNPAFCSNCGAKLIQEPVIQPGVAYAGAVQYAGFWHRFPAYFIDTIIIWVAFTIGFIIGFIFGDVGTVMIYLIAIIGVWLYYALMESSSHQATLGKMALGIIVTDNQGKRISFGRATGRYFAKIISALILCIGYLMIAFTQKKQGLHDLMANTLVVLK